MELASLKQTTRSSRGLSNFCKICGGVGEVERATGKETKQSFVFSLSRLLQVDSIVLLRTANQTAQFVCIRRKVLNITWSDKVCKEEVLRHVGEERAIILVINRRQRVWLGHTL